MGEGGNAMVRDTFSHLPCIRPRPEGRRELVAEPAGLWRIDGFANSSGHNVASNPNATSLMHQG
eukprot:scaffold273599_cov35-Tisochrysis_lutea.AAC.1